MIPSFARRLSGRLSLTKKLSEKKGDEAKGRPSLSRRSTKELKSKDDDRDARPETSVLKRKSTLDRPPLSKRPTIQLGSEGSTTSKSSRQVTLQKSLSKKSSIDGADKTPPAPTKTLSKKLSSASKTTSLTSKPILAGRAPSLTARASKESMTKKTPVTVEKTKKEKPKGKTLWYISGNYVTVRNDDGGWFLCRLQHKVYNTTKSVKIRWLSKKRMAADDNDYKLDYRDEIDPACILFSVRVTRDRSTYKLYDEDRLETEKLLKVAADVASGKLTFDDVDSDVEEVVQIELPEKKRKTEGKKKADDKKKKKKSNKGSKEKKSPGEKKREPKTKSKKAAPKEPKRKVAKKKKHSFSESNQFPPFISKCIHPRDHTQEFVKETEKIRYGVLHPNVICDGCHGPVYGIRYKCWYCPNYDLCSECMARTKKGTHNMLEFEEPANNGVFHFNVRCNACNGPVFGVRYKCYTCRLYDLCSGCKARDGHPHHMRVIRKPINDYYMYV